ncbi:hypothetical protein DMR_09680 [Solidesulfovibrio magneticus RS-1]|uniref:Uncharacterized protein n=1 Tax=Solidesulfovibrio magneticus (strain ATCC 700980 / DSM 13731 / RS-1) TaxID=573370 RepID=C4XKS0_SOLM1|nr:hypothetical protein DMR_09680 [Solidesulfovibrio magneticus RS-1]
MRIAVTSGNLNATSLPGKYYIFSENRDNPIELYNRIAVEVDSTKRHMKSTTTTTGEQICASVT